MLNIEPLLDTQVHARILDFACGSADIEQETSEPSAALAYAQAVHAAQLPNPAINLDPKYALCGRSLLLQIALNCIVISTSREESWELHPGRA